MVPHGWLHHGNYECLHWSKEFMNSYLDLCDNLEGGFQHGFKAPGWQISDGCYEALLERNYWVADQAYNNFRRPTALRTYLLDSPEKLHGHVGYLDGGANGNELEVILPEIYQHTEFGFVSDHSCLWQPTISSSHITA